MDKILKFNIKLETNGKEVFHKLTVNAETSYSLKIIEKSLCPLR